MRRLARGVRFKVLTALSAINRRCACAAGFGRGRARQSESLLAMPQRLVSQDIEFVCVHGVGSDGGKCSSLGVGRGWSGFPGEFRPCPRGLGKCGQATKGTWGMSWRQEALKGVEDCEKLGVAVKRALIPRFPNCHALNP